MLAYRLRHRVDIEERVEALDDDTGAITHDWKPAALGGRVMRGVPAEILSGPGRELAGAGTKLAETTARIHMRWFPGLRPDMRIVWEGQPMDIISIETDATARREYWVKVKSGVTDGT